MRFAPEYVACVLNENFEDAKTNFLSPLMALHYAHLVMLAERGIVSGGDAHAIRVALDSVQLPTPMPNSSIGRPHSAVASKVR